MTTSAAKRHGAAAALSARLGIETRYRDQTGAWRQVPESTLHALWTSLGVPEQRDPAGALAYLEQQERQAFPSVFVVNAGKRSPIPVRLPAATRRVRWQVRHEDGDEQRGDAGLSGRGGELRLPVRLPAGYHRLTLEWSGAPAGAANATLIAVPSRAHLPSELRRRKVWGLAAQLYALRSSRNWGIGDFGDLESLIAHAAAAGADVVGVNPLHALFPDEPERASPYSPSSRMFRNPLYLDVEAIEDFGECPAAQRLVSGRGFAARRQRLQERPLIDYDRVAQLKLEVLALLHASFGERHLTRAGDARAADFAAYRQRLGADLRRFATFHALRAHLVRGRRSADSRSWPAEFRDPGSPAVAAFAKRHAREIEFIEYLQWQAERQLGRAAFAARDSGMAVGLYQDLAVGFDPDGADAWSLQGVLAEGWNIGAPPDAWSPKGQDWGLAPLNPQKLRAAAYAPLIATLRANMRHAGALRIDHILGLKRLFWVPRGGSPVEGAYVRYPLAELLGIVALESVRERCLVVGEDLGTVPAGFSATLRNRGILSYRVLYFSRTPRGGFERPRRWPRLALGAITTHDLPTFAGYWHGDDIDLRERLSLYLAPTQARRERTERATARRALTAALAAERLATGRGPPIRAAHRFLARTPTRIAMVQLEDLIGLREQANLPGTVGEHPNWRRKLPITGDALFEDAAVRLHLDVLSAERPAPTDRTALPRATYRLQLSATFTFDDAAATLPYLARLGVSHVYLSPIFAAQEGSAHGYDTTSYDRLSPELGGNDGFRRLTSVARALGLKVLVDFVPNHMGIGQARNEWWLDVLEWGRASPAADIFDIDWAPIAWPELHGRLTVPLLGDAYEKVCQRSELRLRFDEKRGSFAVWYHGHCFPVRPRDYPAILAHATVPLRSAGPRDAATPLTRLAAGFARLDSGTKARRRAAALKAALARWAIPPANARALAAAAAALTGDREALDELLRRQVYLLALWRTASQRINYRRFFDINQLAGVRMDRPDVFARCHRRLAQLIVDDQVHGLRLDHVDGLYDPADYCRRLRHLADRASAGRGPFYIVVEKILAADENLTRWPVHGTTGYEFANLVNALLVDKVGVGRIAHLYSDFVGNQSDFDTVRRQSKRHVVEQLFGGELTALGARIARVSATGGQAPRYDSGQLAAALADVTVEFSVYRTYIGNRGPSARDRQLIAAAVSMARIHGRVRNARLLGFLRAILMGDRPSGVPVRCNPEILDIARRFQQLTAPVQAKALEDTAFYRYVPLASLNEVGGDLRRRGASPSEFHAQMAERARRWPGAMLATATHDTKRGEDARVRISVLSELPGLWGSHLGQWSEWNRALVNGRGTERAPSLNDEYLIYQTLLGAWPMEFTTGAPSAGPLLDTFAERLDGYIVKAIREAKVRTSWIAPDGKYEQACRAFVRGILDPGRSERFLAGFTAFAAGVCRSGAVNSLAQTVLKFTAPGVPDIYRGCERWDLSLVDPDNRRQIALTDYDRSLRDLVTSMAARRQSNGDRIRELSGDWRSGRIKLYATWRLLALRQANQALFARGTYEPLAVNGPAASHIVAFRRRHRDASVIVVASRHCARLAMDGDTLSPRPETWRGTTLSGLGSRQFGKLTDVLSGEVLDVPPSGRIDLAELFHWFTVAVLHAGHGTD